MSCLNPLATTATTVFLAQRTYHARCGPLERSALLQVDTSRLREAAILYLESQVSFATRNDVIFLPGLLPLD